MKKITMAFVSVASCIYHCFFFSFWIYLWRCQMLTPSDLRQPVQYFQWSSVTGCLLQLLIWSLCTQQSGLSTIGWGWTPTNREWSAWAGWLLCMGLGLEPDPSGYFLSSLPKASVPSLSSSLSSLLPHLCQWSTISGSLLQLFFFH